MQSLSWSGEQRRTIFSAFFIVLISQFIPSAFVSVHPHWLCRYKLADRFLIVSDCSSHFIFPGVVVSLLWWSSKILSELSCLMTRLLSLVCDVAFNTLLVRSNAHTMLRSIFWVAIIPALTTLWFSDLLNMCIVFTFHGAHWICDLDNRCLMSKVLIEYDAGGHRHRDYGAVGLTAL